MASISNRVYTPQDPISHRGKTAVGSVANAPVPPSFLPFLSRNPNIPCVELGLTEWNYVTLRWRIGHGKVEIGRVKTPAIVSDGFGRVKALS
ncbi:hypothetical protein ALC56_11508 [Trachymyrmex septentrionalis]|uniref:Uncharacterized protein n=1 Tax=Trachymyrmex septentrionalis TaxID=34720 RepID=A0A195F1E9_9HYME|nr:hypothetical protein ALC56_11508 [Trachymyrmex septentrionalis]